ncbi:SDR family NAD(P)-dependent oxidoreductase [Portibacter lacus]|nr:SDR family NAD(P)-dependent oxidoreductase [Portibacter lacus]
MTGATSGLGKVSALKAANEGATLIVLARDKEKSQLLIEDYKKQYPDGRGKIELVEGNLTSFESTSNACNEVSSRFPVIDMIVNNAGIMNFEYKESDDHIEETFQVNLLSPLLVCHLLLENLKRSNSAKIIFTSSQMHQGEIYFDNLEFKDNFSSFKVYRHSKLAVILVCRTLAEELDKHQIGIYSQHPGMVRTELGRSAGWFAKFIFYLMGSSAEKGSQTLSYLIETKKDLLKTGEYYSQKKVTKTTEQSYNLATGEKIIEVARDYLSPYITSNSLIFKK